jgi:LPS sulfotransferase NodH
MVNFIVLSTQRSGSTFLTTLLNNHPEVECYGEMFMKNNTRKIAYNAYRTDSFQRKFSYIFQRKKLTYSYLENFYSNIQNAKAAGFKLMYRQIKRYPEIITWSNTHNVKIIHLIRANTLKMIVSREIAQARGIYHSTKALEVIKVFLGLRELKIKLKKANQLVEKYRGIFANNNYLELTYESLLAEQDQQIQKLLDFLEIHNVVTLTSHLAKINPDSLEDLIENYQEVAQSFKGTAFEHYLND